MTTKVGEDFLLSWEVHQSQGPSEVTVLGNCCELITSENEDCPFAGPAQDQPPRLGVHRPGEQLPPQPHLASRRPRRPRRRQPQKEGLRGRRRRRRQGKKREGFHFEQWAFTLPSAMQ